MADKKKPKPAQGATLHGQRKSNRFNMKIVLLELKALYPMLDADMDSETRKATERTLYNCVSKLEVIAKFYGAPPKAASTEGNSAGEAAHG